MNTFCNYIKVFAFFLIVVVIKIILNTISYCFTLCIVVSFSLTQILLCLFKGVFPTYTYTEYPQETCLLDVSPTTGIPTYVNKGDLLSSKPPSEAAIFRGRMSGEVTVLVRRFLHSVLWELKRTCDRS